MRHAFGRASHIGARLVKRQWRFRVTKNHVAAHSSGQINHHVGIRIANTVDYFAEQIGASIGYTGLGITYVAVNHGGTSFGRIDRAIGDLLG